MRNKKSLPKRITGVPNAVDVHVGQRLRLRRTLLGLSQEKLGEALGLTFQQVQKYERGTNRIGASRLYDLARVLDIDIGYFFDEMTDEVSHRSPGQIRGMAEEGEELPFQKDPMARRETLELVRAYYKIEETTVRKRLLDMAKTLGKVTGDPPDSTE
ncbi:XRE family transcriptional regulator [Kiloniella litopenaei]|uniref:XRE family transcriptional regulator n=1 Tax=Kiloniella litopenaei TaxID=1549748 RepID=A0A0M2R7D9_9PROT|nr:helix-turn-helix transcriptional regulator [Kiloniella litopenaei]KKJ77601.1 XRE family transcriptional regulator [Kiloniella litopenaei]